MIDDYKNAIVIPEEVRSGPTRQLVRHVLCQTTAKLQAAVREEMAQLKNEEAEHNRLSFRYAKTGDHARAEYEATRAREAHLQHNGAELALAQVIIHSNWMTVETFMAMRED